MIVVHDEGPIAAHLCGSYQPADRDLEVVSSAEIVFSCQTKFDHIYESELGERECWLQASSGEWSSQRLQVVLAIEG